MEDNPYWYSENPFYQSGFGLPNCTAYAWGRRYEITKEIPITSLGNADTWYDFAVANGQRVGSTPQLGAMMVWKYTGSMSGEGGHVSVVEEISEDGTITTSNSAWGGSYFYLDTLTAPYEWSSYTSFQGFIYLDCAPVPPSKKPIPSWNVGIMIQWGAIVESIKRRE